MIASVCARVHHAQQLDPKGSKHPAIRGFWFNNPYYLWLLGLTPLNIGHLDPLGASLTRTTWLLQQIGGCLSVGVRIVRALLLAVRARARMFGNSHLGARLCERGCTVLEMVTGAPKAT